MEVFLGQLRQAKGWFGQVKGYGESKGLEGLDQVMRVIACTLGKASQIYQFNIVRACIFKAVCR